MTNCKLRINRTVTYLGWPKMPLAAPRSTVCELFSGRTYAAAVVERDPGADDEHFRVDFAQTVTGEHGAVLDDAFGRRAMGRTIVDVVASPTRRRRRGVFGRRGRQTSAAARVARYWLGRRHRACLTPAFAPCRRARCGSWAERGAAASFHAARPTARRRAAPVAMFKRLRGRPRGPPARFSGPRHTLGCLER